MIDKKRIELLRKRNLELSQKLEQAKNELVLMRSADADSEKQAKVDSLIRELEYLRNEFTVLVEDLRKHKEKYEVLINDLQQIKRIILKR